MKVKELLQIIENYRKIYSDIDEWEVYIEQPSLIALLNNTSDEDSFKSTNLKESKGWVYRGNNDAHCNHTIFPKNKFIANNNNY